MLKRDEAWATRRSANVILHVPRRAEDAVGVRVALYRSQGRASLTRPGGTVLVAGDICAPATAPAVVEAFLYQLARPTGTIDLGAP